MVRYRIVTDNYCGYEAQLWRWWWPFWVQLGGTNTHISVERAEAYISRRIRRVVKHVTPPEAP